MGRWGAYQERPGGTRYWGQSGTRTLHALTAPLGPQSQRPLADGLLATLLVGLAGASRRLAREAGGQRRRRDRWGWWLRHAALS
jgi:hypothetical protein